MGGNYSEYDMCGYAGVVLQECGRKLQVVAGSGGLVASVRAVFGRKMVSFERLMSESGAECAAFCAGITMLPREI